MALRVDEGSAFAALAAGSGREIDRQTRDALLREIHEICKPLSDKAITAEMRSAILERSKPLVDDVVRADYRLVLRVVSDLPKLGEQEDREAVGLMGLVKAVRDFDPDLGFTFGTFASRYIKNEILRSFSKQRVLGYSDYTQTRRDEIVGPTRGAIRTAEIELENGVGEGYLDRHLPGLLERRGFVGSIESVRDDIMRVEELLIRARADGQPEPQVRQLSSDLTLDPQRVLNARQLLKDIRASVMYEKFPRLNQVELDKPVAFGSGPGEGQGQKSIGEVLGLRAGNGPSESDRVVDREVISAALAKLPAAARHVFRLHALEGFSVKGGRDATLGETLGLSQKRTQVLLDYACRRLRVELRGDEPGPIELPPTDRNLQIEERAAALVRGGRRFVTEAGFIEGIANLREFCRREGNADISPMHIELNGFPLGAWVLLQKRLGREKLLAKERVRAIGIAAPTFSWNLYHASFAEGVAHLRAFFERGPNSRLERGQVEPDGYPLWNWVHKQRTRKHEGLLSEEESLEIESAAPGFEWNPRDARFARNVQRLAAFREKFEHSNVPQSYRDQEGALGTWVDNLRQGRVPLTEERRAAILAVAPDFAWSPRVSALQLSG